MTLQTLSGCILNQRVGNALRFEHDLVAGFEKTITLFHVFTVPQFGPEITDVTNRTHASNKRPGTK
jgi:hypothetical protein